MGLIFCYILLVLIVLLIVAYYTLLERKILGYAQIRKGPNKVGVLGLFQPLSDALKLFTKAPSWRRDIVLIFVIRPVISIILSILLWGLIIAQYYIITFEYAYLIFLAISSLYVYVILLAGWASNSKYAFLGAIRALAQTLSYEVCFIIIILFPWLIWGSYLINTYTWPILVTMAPLFFLWAVTIIVEANRAPFDFSEGESELVSGFNIEYGGFTFAFLFLSEYISIILLSILSIVLFFSNKLLFFRTVVFSLLFLILRATIPRYRYDILMYFCWKIALPVSLGILAIITFAKYNV